MTLFKYTSISLFIASTANFTYAQTSHQPPPLRATLDTIAVTGTTRLLTLAATQGPELPGFPLSPGNQKAVFYARPAADHEYDLTAIRVLVSDQSIRSSTGQVLVDLVLPDSSTHGPTGRRLLPSPLVITNQEVRKAKKGLLTLDVRPFHVAIPATGLFVLAQGAPSPGDKYLGDTLIQKNNGQPGGAAYVKLNSSARPGPLRVVNALSFICIRDIRTSGQPQTWDYWPKKGVWVQRQASYPKCPQCAISNAGLELVVREL